MLRFSLLSSKQRVAGPSASQIGGQWLRGQPVVCYVYSYRRSLANSKKPDETIFPGSESVKKNDDVLDKPPPLPSVTKPAPSTIIPPEGVPKTLPSAEEIEARVAATSRAPTAKAQSPLPSVASIEPRKGPAPSSTNVSNPPPPTPPHPSTLASQPTPPQAQIPRRKPRRFRRFLFSLLILSGLGYAGGVYYSLVSDNFHDFFTEYIPFGDDAVGYFEEREFKRRFPPRAQTPRLHPQLADEPKVTIPIKSGMSARPAGADDDSSTNISSLRGRHMSAIEDVEKEAKPTIEERDKVAEVKRKDAADKTKEAETKLKSEASAAKGAAKKAAGKVQDAGRKVSEKAKEEGKKLSPDEPKKKTAEVKEVTKSEPPPPIQVLPTIDHLKVKDAEEPAVQDLVKMLNDIITVINADKASGKYSSTITNAKDKVNKIIQEIGTLKASEKHAAENEIKSMHQQFDDGAKELAGRLEREMRDQEIHWKEEYESEREKLVHSYENRLKAEIDAAKQVHERQLQNALTEQQIGHIRQFTKMVHDAVEQERGGRLSKLSELEKSVHDLEQLTAESSTVVDKTLQTQHLLVAVDALTAKLDSATRPVPFLNELAAVREAASFGNTDIDHNSNSNNNNQSTQTSSTSTNSKNSDIDQPDPVIHAALSTIPIQIYNTGIPTAADLRARFRTVASQVRKAALLPENTSDAGVASHAASWMLSKFMARKEGLPDGEDVESVLARAESWLARGDLESAAREVNGLKGWAKRLAGDWLDDVRRVCAVRMAVDVMSTEARLQSLLVH